MVVHITLIKKLKANNRALEMALESGPSRIFHKKASQKTARVWIRKWIYIFSKTSIHGFQYIFFPQFSRLERYIWLFICLTTTVISSGLLIHAWIKFTDNPTQIFQDSGEFSIYDFHFPAVTICGMNIISKKRAHQVARGLLGFNSTKHHLDNVVESLRMLVNVVNSDFPIIHKHKYTYLKNLLEMNGLEEHEVIESLAMPCIEFVQSCVWKEEDRKCEYIFKGVTTRYGHCCSFNSHFDNVPSESFDSSSHRKSEYTQLSFGCGHQNGLQILLHLNIDDFFTSDKIWQGFRVLLILCKEYILDMLNSYRVCEFKDLRCTLDVNAEFLNKSKMQDIVTHHSIQCYCPKTCDDLVYRASMTEGGLDGEFTRNIFAYQLSGNVSNYSLLKVFWTDLTGLKQIRDVVFTWKTLMGYYGGIIGLFTGASVATIVEFSYLTLTRFFCTTHRSE